MAYSLHEMKEIQHAKRHERYKVKRLDDIMEIDYQKLSASTSSTSYLPKKKSIQKKPQFNCQQELALFRYMESLVGKVPHHLIPQAVLQECVDISQSQVGVICVSSPSRPGGWKEKGVVGEKDELLEINEFLQHNFSSLQEKTNPYTMSEKASSGQATHRFSTFLWLPLLTPTQDLGGFFLARKQRELFDTKIQYKLDFLVKQIAVFLEILLYNECLEYEVSQRVTELQDYTYQLEKEIEERKEAEQKILACQERLERLVNVDDLTGLYNRRYLFQKGQEEIERSFRYQRNLSAIIFDIDHFKSVNDTYGHLTGDQVIRVIAQTCLEQVRNCDLLGRYGGEEFVVLLPETTQTNALILAIRLKEKIETLLIPTDDEDLSVTCSFGLTELSPEHKTLSHLINEADLALYQAKQKGRNCVVVFHKE